MLLQLWWRVNFVIEMKFWEQIHYCCPTNKMIGKTRAISIFTNNVRDHAIRVGPHTAASEILVELNLVILKIGCALIKYYSCRILLAKISQINHGPHLKLFSKKLTNLSYFSLAVNLMLRSRLPSYCFLDICQKNKYMKITLYHRIFILVFLNFY